MDLIVASQYLKVAYREAFFLSLETIDVTERSGFKLKEGKFRKKILTNYNIMKEIIYCESCEAWEHVAQRSCGRPTPVKVWTHFCQCSRPFRTCIRAAWPSGKCLRKMSMT